MHRCLAIMAGVVVTVALAAPAVADESTDAARATALAVCQNRAKAKNVTVAIKVDGKATNYRYTCSKILAATSNIPAASDFTVGIKLLRKQCFASAGCTIAYRPKLEYRGSTPLDPSKVYTVVYDVDGAASPITANLTMRGSKATAHNATAYTPSKDAKLTARVTSVLEGS